MANRRAVHTASAALCAECSTSTPDGVPVDSSNFTTRKRLRRYPRQLATSSLFISIRSLRPPDMPLPTRRQQILLILMLMASIHVYLEMNIWLQGQRQLEQDHDHSSGQSATLSNDIPLSQQPHYLAMVSPRDYEQYTVRINTWKRDELLHATLLHLTSCPSVAQVQVVWCIDQGQAPNWLSHWNHEGGHLPTPVVVEYHDVNSLNERFAIQHEPPSAAVLSIDDDIMRPCIALDHAFVKWTRNPDRIVGFDARSIDVAGSVKGKSQNTNNSGVFRRDDLIWKYAYMTTTERSNRYALTLTRCAFLHKDYLKSYMRDMPQSIRDMVAENLNCEDIAMSLWVSSQTGGRPPLLADFWAIRSQVKLYSTNKISEGQNHKELRDRCLNQFASTLKLKGRLIPAVLNHKSYFAYGAPPENWEQHHRERHHPLSGYLLSVEDTVQEWERGGLDVLTEALAMVRFNTSRLAFEAGLVENSAPWRKRFHTNDILSPA